MMPGGNKEMDGFSLRKDSSGGEHAAVNTKAKAAFGAATWQCSLLVF
jgi:hypothetical protein